MTCEISLEEFCRQYLPELKSSSELINQSLTHRSYSFENNMQLDNERLEFLGDSLIGSVVSAYLYRKYPDSNEGELSKMKAALVSRSMLGRRALEMGMGELLLLGHGEEKSGILWDKDLEDRIWSCKASLPPVSLPEPAEGGADD